MSRSHTLARSRPTYLYLALAVVLTAGLVISSAADARSVRVDGGSDWSDLQFPDPGPDANDVALGFEFDFFGVTTSTIDISRNGQVSFGGAAISPFVLDGQNTDFFWQTTTENPLPGFPDIEAGFRVCWGCFSEGTEFQLALFDLGGGQYAMEFNYGGLPVPGDGDEAFIGYDNGQGVNFNMLEVLGLINDEWAGFGSQLCPPDPETPPEPTTALACNNFDFSTGSSELPTGYGGYFATYPSDPSEQVVGRYFFLLGEQTDVPEPGSLALILSGMGILAWSRRRGSRRTAR